MITKPSLSFGEQADNQCRVRGGAQSSAQSSARAPVCALVTGATSGIGASFIDQLPPTTNLILTGRNADALAKAKARLETDTRSVETIIADLGAAEDRRALIEKTAAAPIDLLINNAGLGAYGPFTETLPAREREMVEVNVTAIIELTRALLPGMLVRAKRDQRRAGMIVVSSIASFTPMPFLATYAATKAFERHWGEALVEELRGEPVDILVVCPGTTRTDFYNRAKTDASILKKWQLGFTEEPDAVARKALAALGRRTVLVSNPTTRFALAPLLWPRRLFTRAFGRFMRSVRSGHSERRHD